MTLVIELTSEEEARLKAAARREGVNTVEFVRRTLTERLPPLASGPDAENAALIALLESWIDADAQGEPEEIAAREWEEMEASLGANRLSLPIPDVR